MSTEQQQELTAYQVGIHILKSLYYIPDYITDADEQRILGEVHASQSKWVQLSGRRLQNHGGVVHTKGLIPAPMPRWLEQLGLRIHNHLPLFGGQPPNHVLINSYQPGFGIMPHQDGPLYHPVVCILSLGSPAVLRFWRKQPEGGTGGQPPVASLLAMPRSLLVFADDAYEGCLHGIEEVTEETIDETVVNREALQQYLQQHQPHRCQGNLCQCPSQQQQQQMRQDTPEQQQCQLHQPQQLQTHQPQQLQTHQQDLQLQTHQQDLQLQTHQQDLQQHQSNHQQQQQQQCEGLLDQGCQLHASELCPDKQAGTDCAVALHSCDADFAVKVTVPRQGERVSLTIRRVLKVHKALGLLRR